MNIHFLYLCPVCDMKVYEPIKVAVEDPLWVAVSISKQLQLKNDENLVTIRNSRGQEHKVPLHWPHQCSPHNFGFAALIGTVTERDKDKYLPCN